MRNSWSAGETAKGCRVERGGASRVLAMLQIDSRSLIHQVHGARKRLSPGLTASDRTITKSVAIYRMIAPSRPPSPRSVELPAAAIPLPD